ncbi:MAG: hypothetical protein ABSC71_08355 [Candidatus Acidiferrales bacterium]
MTPPFLGLEIAVLSSDLDVVELRVAAWNGAFAGLLRLYVGHGYLDELADQIAGFPTGLGDERSFALTCDPTPLSLRGRRRPCRR